MTYSIVARDPQTGQLGVAVQSHFFSVGPIVPWTRPGVGAVATQAFAEISYGPRALDLMESGLGARAALDQLLGEDSAAHARQVAVLSASGEVAVHTGARCMRWAGHVVGDGFSCQGNILASARVWESMHEAFSASDGALADRLLGALDAAEAAGGDRRGRQSAAIVVAPGEGEPWRTELSLRVEDHPEPLVELRRLIALDAAYSLASRADDMAGEGRHDEAAELYRAAGELAPDNHELLFWAGLGAARIGDLDTALRDVRAAIALHPPWRELLDDVPSEIAPAAERVLQELDPQAG